MAKKKPKKTITFTMGKRRNPLAVSAWNCSGSGRHPDRKKRANKKACRGKVKDY